MKKLFLALAVLASVTVANAQQNVKTESAAKSALEAAQAAAANAKKATKVATWLKLASSYMDAYTAPMGNGWVGASPQELAIVMGNQKPVSETNVTVNGTNYVKKAFNSADYYFNQAGQLAIINVTKPIVADALAQAINAYKEAAKVDAAGSKTADIIKGIQNINNKYVEEAYNAYTLGDYAKASKLFENAADALATAPCSQVDSNSLYNCAFTAWAAKDTVKAQNFFHKCLDVKYYGEDGDVYAKLATIASDLGNVEEQKALLEEGFAAYPSSQAILIGLINYYTASGEETDRLFTLLDGAKKNEPDNASLYYVEGNIYKELGKLDEAVASYRQCAVVNPAYEYGYIGEALLRYNQAFDIQEEAQKELDDAKYMALVEKFDEALKACIEPFEKALETTKDAGMKRDLAEYLKNACFRYRDQDASFQEKYDKYSAMAAATE